MAALETLEKQLLAASRSLAPVPTGLAQGRSTGFMLASECAADLGGADLGSAFFLAWRRGADFTDDVRVAGSEPAAIKAGATLGVFVRIAGEALTEDLAYMVTTGFRKSLACPGVMVKGSGSEIWIRMTHEAIAAGMDFAVLGWSIIEKLHKNFAELAAVRIIFVTDDPVFAAMQAEAAAYDREQEAMKARVWDKRGFNFEDCSLSAHCGQCSDKKTCANVRRMERIVKVTRPQEGAASA